MTRSQFIKRAQRHFQTIKAAQDAQDEFSAELGEFLLTNEAKALAKEVEVSDQYLSDVRHKRRAISAVVLERIAELETKS